MSAEMPSRGMTTSADRPRTEYLAAHLNAELDLLGV
jgi:hypothetical protein